MSSNGQSWYAEMCKRPEWQRKRLQIMERDNWQCQECGAIDKTLAVHHRYYKRGAMPWEYPDAALATVCETCHAKLAENYEDISGLLLDLLYQRLQHGGVDQLARGLANTTGMDCALGMSIQDAARLYAPGRLDGTFERLEDLALWLSPRYAEEKAEQLCDTPR